METESTQRSVYDIDPSLRDDKTPKGRMCAGCQFGPKPDFPVDDPRMVRFAQKRILLHVHDTLHCHRREHIPHAYCRGAELAARQRPQFDGDYSKATTEVFGSPVVEDGK